MIPRKVRQVDTFFFIFCLDTGRLYLPFLTDTEPGNTAKQNGAKISADKNTNNDFQNGGNFMTEVDLSNLDNTSAADLSVEEDKIKEILNKINDEITGRNSFLSNNFNGNPGEVLAAEVTKEINPR